MNAQFVMPPAHVGSHEVWLMYGSGPSSYSQTTGDVIQVGGGQYLEALHGDVLTVSGNYIARPMPSVVNSLRPTWAWKWFYSGQGQTLGVDGVVIASAGSSQTNGTYTATASAGGAVIQYTIAGNVLSSVKILNPGSGLTAVPTFTLAANGGTAGTVTATIGSIAGMEVATGTNLSGESIQFVALGGLL